MAEAALVLTGIILQDLPLYAILAVIQFLYKSICCFGARLPLSLKAKILPWSVLSMFLTNPFFNFEVESAPKHLKKNNIATYALTLDIQKLIFLIMKQLLFDKIPKRKTFFGGSLLKKSHAKSARPLSTKLPIHLVLKSSNAKGIFSFLSPRNTKRIKVLLTKTSKIFKIQVLEYSINSNHLHLLIRGKRRDDIKNFMRTLSALVSRFVQNKHKNRGAHSIQSRLSTNHKILSRNPNFRTNSVESLSQTQSFWDQRPFTRIVEGYKGYVLAKDYIALNQLEALRVIPYKPRKPYYSSA